MKYKYVYDLVMWAFIVIICALFYPGSADASTTCRDHYCAEVPDSVIVVNKDNWKNHRNLLPEPIIEKMILGSNRELWIFTEDKNISVAIEYKDGRIRIDNPDSYCETIEEKLNEPMMSCGHVFPYRRLRGLQSISYKGSKEISYIRIFMPLNGGSVYFVCTGRWENERVVKKVYGQVREIIKTMRIKR